MKSLIFETLELGHMTGTRIPHSILVHDLLAIEIKIISETSNCNKFKSQCQEVNHGPLEWSSEFLFPYRPFMLQSFSYFFELEDV